MVVGVNGNKVAGGILAALGVAGGATAAVVFGPISTVALTSIGGGVRAGAAGYRLLRKGAVDQTGKKVPIDVSERVKLDGDELVICDEFGENPIATVYDLRKPTFGAQLQHIIATRGEVTEYMWRAARKEAMEPTEALKQSWRQAREEAQNRDKLL